MIKREQFEKWQDNHQVEISVSCDILKVKEKFAMAEKIIC